VNTTDSAAGSAHSDGADCSLPDGRSQIKNKERALSILRARLLERRQREEAIATSRPDRHRRFRKKRFVRKFPAEPRHRSSYRVDTLQFGPGDGGDLGELMTGCKPPIWRNAEESAVPALTRRQKAIATVLQVASNHCAISKHTVESPRLNAEHLLAHVLGQRSVSLQLNAC
jgi:hypothetical protein